MYLQIRFVLEHFPATIASARPDYVFVVNFFHVSLERGPGAKYFQTAFALEVFKNLSHIRMHALYVNLQFLRLTKLSPAEIAERTASLGIFGTSIGTVHFQIVEP